MPPFRALPLLALPLVVGVADRAGAAPGDVRAPEVRIAGEVVRSSAARVRGGQLIVTDLVVRTDEGEVTVRQTGGTLDGVAMVRSHAPPLLVPGDRVELSAARRVDLRGRARLQIRSVDRLVAAPIADRAMRADFVRTLNSSGTAIHWASSCAFIAYAPGGTADIAGDDETAAIDAVFATWRSATDGCSYFGFELEGEAADGEVGNDGINLVRFRDDEWCRPATDDDAGECYDARAAGLTTMFFVNDPSNDRDGEILDADIELNAANFAFAIDGDTEDAGGCIADLANTLTHEVGHLVGLDHTCWNGEGSQPRDDQGELVTSCSGSLSSEARNATMFALQDCGETSKASPADDDIAGYCAIYPLAMAPDGECTRPSSGEAGCCAVAGRTRDPRGAAPFALLALAAIGVLRRRGRLRQV